MCVYAVRIIHAQEPQEDSVEGIAYPVERPYWKGSSVLTDGISGTMTLKPTSRKVRR
jgi:hypothetical protein